LLILQFYSILCAFQCCEQENLRKT